MQRWIECDVQSWNVADLRVIIKLNDLENEKQTQSCINIAERMQQWNEYEVQQRISFMLWFR